MLNLDDPETRALADVVPADKAIGYGFDSPGADFMGKDLELLPDGRHASRSRPRASGMRSRLPVPGRHNASNALAALAAVRALGVPLEEAAAALARFDGLKRRLETVGNAARRHGDRRFRAQSRQDRRDTGDACARSPAGC